MKLINNLISLKLFNFSKKEITIINQCIEKIEKIAILHYNLVEINPICSEKEIDQLNNIEEKFKEKLHQVIAHAEMVYIHPPRDAFVCFFNDKIIDPDSLNYLQLSNRAYFQ